MSINDIEKTIASGMVRALFIYFKIMGRYIPPDFARNTIPSLRKNFGSGALTSWQLRNITSSLILIPH